MDDEYPRTHDFAAAVAAILLAGDIQARMVSNAEHVSIEVSLIDGTRVLWGNARDLWAYTTITEDGITSSDTETLPWDVEVSDAAKMIAMHDYPAPAQYPQEQPG